MLKFLPRIIGIYIVPTLQAGRHRVNMTSPVNILKLLKGMKHRSTKNKQKTFNYPPLYWCYVIRRSAGRFFLGFIIITPRGVGNCSNDLVKNIQISIQVI